MGEKEIISLNKKSMEEKKMYTGDWSCQDCGTAIDGLPFEPKDPSTISCRDCHSKKSPYGKGSVRIQKIYCGDWKCCECEAPVDELPFKPMDPETVACRDCHQKNA